jgi:TPR repeat protein
VGVSRNEAKAYAWLALAAAQGLSRAVAKKAMMENHLTPRILLEGRKALDAIREQLRQDRD